MNWRLLSSIAWTLACCAPAQAQAGDDPAVAICEAIVRRDLPKDVNYRRIAAAIDGRTVEIDFASEAAATIRKRCLFRRDGGHFIAEPESPPERAACDNLQRDIAALIRSGRIDQARQFEKEFQGCIALYKAWQNVEAAFMLFSLELPGYPIPRDKTALR